MGARKKTKARFVRERLRLTQEEFAALMGCAMASVYRWEQRDPPGLNGELLSFIEHELGKRSERVGATWGQKLRKAREQGFATFLLTLSMPPTAETGVGTLVAPVDAHAKPRGEEEPLTARQRFLAAFITDTIALSGAPPTLAELRQALGTSPFVVSPAVLARLAEREAKPPVPRR